MRYRFGDYTLDTSRWELRCMGKLIKLRPKVFDVLLYLIAQRDRVVSRQELFDHLWPRQFVGETTLNSCIREARQAIGDAGKAQRLIQTLHGRGYRFVGAVEAIGGGQPAGETHALPVPPRRSAEGAATGHQAPPVASTSDHLAPAAAPPSVLRAQASSWLERDGASLAVLDGERKPVTILCCALADAGGLAAQVGSEAMYRLMQGFFALALRVMQRYAGTVTQRLSAGFVALFGAPVAHEDHARRAVLAALELQRRVRGESALRMPVRGAGLSTSMGLHSGVVIVGRLGEEAHTLYLYAAPCDTTDVAGWLQRLAPPDTILMSEATHRLVQEEVQAEASGALAMRELPRPLPVYKVCGVLVRRAGVSGRGGRLLSPFVGRARELASLQALLAQAAAGQGQVVGIVGEPGIGKSRLLYEFAQTLRDSPVEYLEGHCLPHDQATPYGPALGLLRQLCGMTDGDSPEAVGAKLRHGLREAGLTPEEDAHYLLPLLGVPEDTTALAGISPEVRKARTLAILRHVSLHSRRGQPRIIAVENVHWIDPTSEEYLARLADGLSGAKLLLVTTYRPGYSPPWLGKSYAAQLSLPRLLSQDSRVVVRSVLPATADRGPWEQTIVDTAAGNPFFLEELAWAIREGSVEQPTAVIPASIQAVLAARVDRLPPAEKRLLQAAAVIGHEVPLRLLQAIAEMPEDVLQRRLARLQAGEFLYEMPLAPDPAYAFKHALTQQVTYDSLLQERRRTLHARILDAVEELHADRLAEQVERLAHHAWWGELWEKAVAYLRQAGMKAIAGSANREAVAHFERALAALEHLPEGRKTREAAIDLRLDLRNALWPLGEFGRIFDCLRDAESLARALGDRWRLGQVSGHLTAHFATMGRHGQAIASGQQTLAIAKALGDVALRVRANYRLGVAHNAQGNYARAIEILSQTVASLAGERSRERFGMAGLPAVFCLGELARSLAALGRFAEGIAHAEEAVAIAEAVDHPLTLIDAYLGVGGLYLRKGDFHQAIPVLERALELCQVAEMPAFAPWVASTLGYAQAQSGHVAAALPLLEQAVERATAMGRRGSHALRLAWLSEAYLLANRIDKASSLALQALDLARTHQERGHQAWICRLLGDIHAHQEPPAVEQAEEIYQQAVALAEELGMRPLQAHCRLGLGMLYTRLGRQEQARRELSTAVELYRTMAMSFWLPRAEAALVRRPAR